MTIIKASNYTEADEFTRAFRVILRQTNNGYCTHIQDDDEATFWGHYYVGDEAFAEALSDFYSRMGYYRLSVAK